MTLLTRDGSIARKLGHKEVHHAEHKAIGIAPRVEEGPKIPPALVSSVLTNLTNDFLHLQRDQRGIDITVSGMEIGQNLVGFFWMAFRVKLSMA